jgi:hypothetical protein
LLLATGVTAVYFADEDLLRALEPGTPPTVQIVSIPADPQVPQAHGILRLSPVWIGAMLQPTGARVAFEPPADPLTRDFCRQSQSYLDETAAARAFIVAYRESSTAGLELSPAHPYRLALECRRDEKALIAVLNQHRIGDAASLQKLKITKRVIESPYANRELAQSIEALVKLEGVGLRYPPLGYGLDQWIIAWNSQASSQRLTEDLARRAADYRAFTNEYPQAHAWARIADAEAKKADTLAKALAQLDRSDEVDTLRNLQALDVVLSILERDRHLQAFDRARQAVVQWCLAEVPGELPLDKVWIGSPRKSAVERRDVKIEWEDGTITALDQPHRGVVYHEEELRRLDKSLRSKITIHTPLGTGSLDDLIASEATKDALEFNAAARQLKERLAEPASYRSIAEAFRAAHKAGGRLEPARRDRLAKLADGVQRYERWDR